MNKSISCPVCNSKATNILPILNDTPLEDTYTKTPNDLKATPLDTFCCSFCGLVFLQTKLDPNESYSEYLYNSSTTVGLKSHFSLRAASLIDLYDVKPEEVILDLGCNDGSFLNAFNNHGYKNLYGVEPAPEPFSIAKNNGLKVFHNYFDKNWVDNNPSISPKIITANYMFANIPNPIEFMKQCSRLMAKDSVLSVETGYHPIQFSNNMIDYIYHEHFYYFTIKSLSIMADKCDLAISSVRQNQQKGGSVEVDFVRKDSKYISKSCFFRDLFIKQEDFSISEYKKEYERLNLRIENNIIKIKKFIKSFLDEGGEIVAFGASHSTTTLLHLLNAKELPIKFIIDDNQIKQGRYSPGLNIPIVDYKFAKSENIKTKTLVLCLAWQHSRSILKRHLGNLNEFCWLIPFPETNLIFPIL